MAEEGNDHAIESPDGLAPPSKGTSRRRRVKTPAPEAEADTANAAPTVPPRRGRSTRPFPAAPFEEAYAFAKEIYEFGSGQQVRRLSLFDHLQRTPDSGPSRQLITNANKYGLIKGNYAGEHLELTPEGKRVCDESTSPRERARTKAKLAVTDIAPFEAVYQRFVNAKLPARAALIDSMREAGVEADYLEEGVDTFIVNLKAVGLLQTLSGADRVVTIEHLLDMLPGSPSIMGPAQAPSVSAPSQTDYSRAGRF